MSNEILNKIGEAAVLEQLAEECTELAQSALKLARKIRGENPTPKSLEECKASLQEEAADVELCIDILPDGYIDWTEYSRTIARKRMLFAARFPTAARADCWRSWALSWTENARTAR